MILILRIIFGHPYLQLFFSKILEILTEICSMVKPKYFNSISRCNTDFRLNADEDQSYQHYKCFSYYLFVQGDRLLGAIRDTRLLSNITADKQTDTALSLTLGWPIFVKNIKNKSTHTQLIKKQECECGFEFWKSYYTYVHIVYLAYKVFQTAASCLLTQK